MRRFNACAPRLQLLRPDNCTLQQVRCESNHALTTMLRQVRSDYSTLHRLRSRQLCARLRFATTLRSRLRFNDYATLTITLTATL